MKNYIKNNDRIYPIIRRKKGAELTDRCPYCNDKHIHGSSDGHRNVHCSGNRDKYINIEGFEISQSRGYIIVEY